MKKIETLFERDEKFRAIDKVREASGLESSPSFEAEAMKATGIASSTRFGGSSA